ncbi:hypothetical protein O6H91_13G030600 [Diphasiastrum complanatum]|uniref:Uncharacterized protein n=1 Tax=Diphasiastrum complanatum TaxID=34168 RepID=A0ACC2BTC4_DIPCM|nr:hypothetical protein O6H91_13G030600 [Diphasiastrum complanatum]
MVEKKPTVSAPAKKEYCLCSPTTHPGSFRCRWHRSAFIFPQVPKAKSKKLTRDSVNKVPQLDGGSRSSNEFLDQVINPSGPKLMCRAIISRPPSILSNVAFGAQMKKEDDLSDLLAYIDKEHEGLLKQTSTATEDQA